MSLIKTSQIVVLVSRRSTATTENVFGNITYIYFDAGKLVAHLRPNNTAANCGKWQIIDLSSRLCILFR